MNPLAFLPLGFAALHVVPKAFADAHAAVIKARSPDSPDGAKIDALEFAGIFAIAAKDIVKGLAGPAAKVFGVTLPQEAVDGIAAL